MVMVVVDGEQWITLRIVCRRLMKCVPEDDICGDDGEQWITLRIVCRRLMKCVPEDDICGDGGGRCGTVDHFEDCV